MFFKDRVRVDRSNITKHQVDIAVSPKIEFANIIKVNDPQRWSDVAKLIRAPRLEIDAETPAHQRAIVRKAVRTNAYVVRPVFGDTTIRVNEPINVRISLARFDEQIDPLRPFAEVVDNNDY